MKAFKPAALTALCCSAVALSATAQDRTGSFIQPTSERPDYTFAQVRYVRNALDGLNCDPDGFNLAGSLELNEFFFVHGHIDDTSDGICGGTGIQVGGGFHTPYNNRFDLVARVALQTFDVDYGESDSGLVLSGAMRGYLRDELETEFGVFHDTTFDGDTGVYGRALYWFDPRISGILDLSLSGDTTTLGLGARFAF